VGDPQSKVDAADRLKLLGVIADGALHRVGESDMVRPESGRKERVGDSDMVRCA